MLPARALEGVDVSGWQPRVIDWQRARACRLAFAYVKTSEGSSITSAAWAHHADAARNAGVLVGPYHFVRWHTSVDAPEAQIADLARVCGGPRAGDLRPALDLETGGIMDRDLWPRARRLEWLVRAVELVSQEWGCTPVIYAGAQFAADELGIHAEDVLGRCPWWRPSYVSEPRPDCAGPTGRPKIYKRGPYRERHCEIWQWTGHGRLPWLAGEVDRNVVPGGETALARLIVEG